MRQLKGVSMKVLYEKHSSESTPAFFYEGRQLYHLHLRGAEMSATFHTDFKSRLRLTENQNQPINFYVFNQQQYDGYKVTGVSVSLLSMSNVPSGTYTISIPPPEPTT